MATKKVNTRVMNKCDLDENWRLATNFTPKKGELIIYQNCAEPATSTNYVTGNTKFKIGDGTTKVGDLPFQADGTNYSVVEITTSQAKLTDEQYNTLAASPFNKIKYNDVVYNLYQEDPEQLVYTANYFNNGDRITIAKASKNISRGYLSSLTSISPYVKNNLDYSTSNNTYALSAYQGKVLNDRLTAVENASGGGDVTDVTFGGTGSALTITDENLSLADGLHIRGKMPALGAPYTIKLNNGTAHYVRTQTNGTPIHALSAGIIVEFIYNSSVGGGVWQIWGVDSVPDSIYNFVGEKDKASNGQTTNGNTYLKLYENGGKQSQFNIKGTGATTVTSDANGNITINSTDTDTKVTSVNNHYTPTANSTSEISKDASSTTEATWGTTSLVTGVNIQRDAKGHVTGMTLDSIKMPAKPEGGSSRPKITLSTNDAQSNTSQYGRTYYTWPNVGANIIDSVAAGEYDVTIYDQTSGGGYYYCPLTGTNMTWVGEKVPTGDISPSELVGWAFKAKESTTVLSFWRDEWDKQTHISLDDGTL